MELYLKALIMGIVEGLTEFLPISSTGHLILTQQLIKFEYAKAELFDVVIQSGAIFAVCLIYRARLARLFKGLSGHYSLSREEVRQQRTLFFGLSIAFLPLALLGLAFHKKIEEHLFQAIPVATAFIVGGLIILWIEKNPPAPRKVELEDISILDALKLGLFQALALMPGTSRSGATIIGGMVLGLSRSLAAEFSFFLAIPTLLIASIYKLWKARHDFSLDDAGILLAGTIAAFISAWIVIKVLISFVSKHKFTSFAWYRIAFGLLILLTHYQGWILWQK